MEANTICELTNLRLTNEVLPTAMSYLSGIWGPTVPRCMNEIMQVSELLDKGTFERILSAWSGKINFGGVEFTRDEILDITVLAGLHKLSTHPFLETLEKDFDLVLNPLSMLNAPQQGSE